MNGLHLPRRRLLLKLVALVGLASIGLTQTLLANASSVSTPSVAPGGKASFVLDGVSVAIDSPLLPSPVFSTASLGNASQVATSVTTHPYRELSVIAVPFGTKPGIENVPIARPAGEASYAAALRTDRIKEGGTPEKAPTASIFGERVTGSAVTVQLSVEAGTSKPTWLVEWVGGAGSRLWIVRISQEVTSRSLPNGSLTGLRLVSSTLDARTSVSPDPRASRGLALPSGGDLTAPPWWSGDCDYNNYVRKTGTGSFRLGATYLGMPACGPRPIAGGPDALVYFFSGAWGEYEWECVELVMRCLYLYYNIAPYSANGNQVVSNYTGPALQKINNAAGSGTAPVVGDVLSYCPTCTFGHTSIVSSSSVDGSGNGNITVIEQNNSSGGSSTLSVSNWFVNGNAGAVSGWLHRPPRIDLLARGGDGNLWQKSWGYGGCWQNCWNTPSIGQPPTGSLISDPGATWWMGNTQLDVFAQGSDNHLWQRACNLGSTCWGAWNDLGSYPTGSSPGTNAPAVAGTTASRIDVFVTGDQLYWKYWGGGSCWAGCWIGLGNPSGATLRSHPAAVWWQDNGTIDVFVQGSDDQLWQIYCAAGNACTSASDWKSNGTTGPTWVALGNYPQWSLDHTYRAAPATAAYAAGNRIDVLVRGPDGVLYQKYWPSCWSGCWGSLGQPQSAFLAGDPGASWWNGTRLLDIEVQGSDGHVWQKQWQPGWQPWADLGPWAQGTVASASIVTTTFKP